mmetsp:Transcript_21584/g.43759  ORF Transcript_21584/g.43759 Transcript_21584/m.43759 type:complete len:231 (+) Transcript_21584:308-1000(+)
MSSWSKPNSSHRLAMMAAAAELKTVPMMRGLGCSPHAISPSASTVASSSVSVCGLVFDADLLSERTRMLLVPMAPASLSAAGSSESPTKQVAPGVFPCVPSTVTGQFFPPTSLISAIVFSARSFQFSTSTLRFTFFLSLYKSPNVSSPAGMSGTLTRGCGTLREGLVLEGSGAKTTSLSPSSTTASSGANMARPLRTRPHGTLRSKRRPRSLKFLPSRKGEKAVHTSAET